MKAPVNGDGAEEQKRLMAVETFLHQNEYARSLLTPGGEKGMARAVEVLLDGRKVALSEEDRARIAPTTDMAVLGRWVLRASFVSSVENLFA